MTSQTLPLAFRGEGRSADRSAHELESGAIGENRNALDSRLCRGHDEDCASHDGKHQNPQDGKKPFTHGNRMTHSVMAADRCDEAIVLNAR